MTKDTGLIKKKVCVTVILVPLNNAVKSFTKNLHRTFSTPSVCGSKALLYFFIFVFCLLCVCHGDSLTHLYCRCFSQM